MVSPGNHQMLAGAERSVKSKRVVVGTAALSVVRWMRMRGVGGFGGVEGSRGFSMVELLVGVAVSLAVLLVTLQLFAQSSAVRRATHGAADAQQSAAVVGWQLNRELKAAGAGIVQDESVWGCALNVTRNGQVVLPRPTPWPEPFAKVPAQLRALPVLIVDGGSGQPDIVVQFSARAAGSNTALPATFEASTPALEIGAPLFGFRRGDLVLLTSAKTSSTPVGNCRVLEVDSTFPDPPSAVIPTRFGLGSGAPGGFNTGSVATTLGAMSDLVLFHLGSRVGMSLFGVAIDQSDPDLVKKPWTQRRSLVMLDALGLQTTAVPLIMAEEVIDFQALYGVDDGLPSGSADDNRIDRWVSPASAGWDAASLLAASSSALRIKALRIAMIIRGGLTQTNTRSATLRLFPDLSAQGLALDVDVSRFAQYPLTVVDQVIPLPNSLLALCSADRRARGLPVSGACP